MTKNPFMSAYLSAANRVANTARGHATNEFTRCRLVVVTVGRGLVA